MLLSFLHHRDDLPDLQVRKPRVVEGFPHATFRADTCLPVFPGQSRRVRVPAPAFGTSHFHDRLPLSSVVHLQATIVHLVGHGGVPMDLEHDVIPVPCVEQGLAGGRTGFAEAAVPVDLVNRELVDYPDPVPGKPELVRDHAHGLVVGQLPFFFSLSVF